MACLFVEQLTVIDCAWLHGQRGLLGESWLVDLELEGRLDYQGMVLDFGCLKPQVKDVIDGTMDHRLLVPARSGGLRLEQRGSAIELWYDYDGHRLYHRSPPEALCLLDAGELTIAAVEARLAAEIQRVMPDNVEAARITLRPESIAGASFRYVHGLEQHEGNCQRIAHGHRSRVEIYRDDERNDASERWLAERWRDIYIGSRAHLVGETRLQGHSCYRFAYRAPQGEFELVIDKSAAQLRSLHYDGAEILSAGPRLELWRAPTDNIAPYIAGFLKQRDPAARYRVRAYEGVRKGAIAEA